MSSFLDSKIAAQASHVDSGVTSGETARSADVASPPVNEVSAVSGGGRRRRRSSKRRSSRRRSSNSKSKRRRSSRYRRPRFLL